MTAMSVRCLEALDNVPLCKQFICCLPVATGNKMITSGSTSVNSFFFFFLFSLLIFNVESSSFSQKKHENFAEIFALSAHSNRKLDSMSWV